MFDLTIMKVAYAVVIAEGWKPPYYNNDSRSGSESYQRHNPGNLRESEYECSNDDNFSIFSNDIIGFYALIRQLELYATGRVKIAGANGTMREAFSVYTGLNKDSVELDNYLSIIEKYSGLKDTDSITKIL